MNRREKIMAWVKEATNFIERDVWKIPLKDLPPRKSFLIKQLRIFILAFRGFKEDALHLRASALTYYTLLAIVPVVAMGFGIAKGFGLEAFLDRQLKEAFTGREDVYVYIMEFANSMLQTTQGGVVAGVGLAILLYTIIIVMVYVEEAFNGIWQIKQSRPFARKVSDYFAMIFVAPIFLILSSTASVFVTTQISLVMEQLNVLDFMEPTILFLVNLTPYVFIWIVFTLLYMVMPNTNVKLSSALIGAIIAGSIFIVIQWAYIYFQVGVSRYNAIYGSFAALPLLLLWIRLSWLIVLFGAEISFANQNVEYYEFENESKNISPYNRKILSLFVYNAIAKRFEAGDSPLTPPQLSHELEIPIKLIREVLDDLNEIKLISETKSDHHKENAWQPATDIHKVSVRSVLHKLDHKGMDVILARDTQEIEKIKQTLWLFNNTLEKMPENRLIKDL